MQLYARISSRLLSKSTTLRCRNRGVCVPSGADRIVRFGRVLSGDMAPGFRLQDQNGKVHQLSQYRGKNVVLVIYLSYW